MTVLELAECASRVRARVIRSERRIRQTTPARIRSCVWGWQR